MTRHHTKAQSQRQQRVGEELRAALVRILERDRLRDPALAGVSITVADVRMSPDLSHARVRVLPLGGGDTAALVKALRRAAGHLRGQLAHEVRMRRVPALGFEGDTEFEEASALEKLFLSPAVARDLEPPKTTIEDDDGDGA